VSLPLLWAHSWVLSCSVPSLFNISKYTTFKPFTRVHYSVHYPNNGLHLITILSWKHRNPYDSKQNGWLIGTTGCGNWHKKSADHKIRYTSNWYLSMDVWEWFTLTPLKMYLKRSLEKQITNFSSNISGVSNSKCLAGRMSLKARSSGPHYKN